MVHGYSLQRALACGKRAALPGCRCCVIFCSSGMHQCALLIIHSAPEAGAGTLALVPMQGVGARMGVSSQQENVQASNAWTSYQWLCWPGMAARHSGIAGQVLGFLYSVLAPVANSGCCKSSSGCCVA
jgi:hypothetical protein